ncbi:Predicted pyrophosphatase or phosphodiesterase, AlkP superfamily [Chryseolinea serpens]|uniref:Predicted pyrophosphatase or phosphodiesterase, AlkP superfamily n=1 Tax=Chryseolinea serpens TaxID=947013 RepID=A0A1M5KES8_9BACT|nr:ectonucleotide pyrophosphatase/phosphodiesterase [Chryseolinea serpens]SHG51205.1 Predicted pyrophosphatase or phosphodiesterase, AlkP superfamily [Chryseolinea serpens]
MNRILIVLLLFITHFSLAQHTASPYVVLVSFDGFRYDYVSRFHPPNFEKFIREGTAAEGMIPSFPSKTFPNHYTLVTGLYPGHHGLVDNQFYDPELKIKYSISNKTVVQNPAFYGGTPLWILAKRQGVRSASCFWVGSETDIQGEKPDYYLNYDEKFSNDKRVQQTLEWLKLPEQERPHFITLYFSLVDTEGHDTGPNSEALKRTVLKADSLLGTLMRGIDETKLPVDMVIVSDHGMVELKEEEPTYVTLGKLFNISDKSVVIANGGTQAHLYTSKPDSLYDVLKKQEENYKIYKRQMLPKSWHYDHPRAGDLLLVVDPGHYIRVARDPSQKWNPYFGVHGFDPSVVKEMRGIFYARGPHIKRGKTIAPFENIHVYPFIAKLLELKVTSLIDGKEEVLKEVIRK